MNAQTRNTHSSEGRSYGWDCVVAVILSVLVAKCATAEECREWISGDCEDGGED